MIESEFRSINFVVDRTDKKLASIDEPWILQGTLLIEGSSQRDRPQRWSSSITWEAEILQMRIETCSNRWEPAAAGRDFGAGCSPPSWNFGQSEASGRKFGRVAENLHLLSRLVNARNVHRRKRIFSSESCIFQFISLEAPDGSRTLWSREVSKVLCVQHFEPIKTYSISEHLMSLGRSVRDDEVSRKRLLCVLTVLYPWPN